MKSAFHVTALTIAAFAGVICYGCSRAPENMSQPSGHSLVQSEQSPQGATIQAISATVFPKTAIRVRKDLVLAIPTNYLGLAVAGSKPAESNSSTDDLSVDSTASFDFFLPDFSGFTVLNSQDPWNQKRVDVVGIRPTDPGEGEPDAPGDYPSNVFKRITNIFISKDNYQNLYGLKCYPESLPKGALQELACFGERNNVTNEQIFLKVNVPPYPDWAVNPQMQAKYFSKKYGGITVVWRTHVDNFPQWREIDQQIWRFLDDWNTVGRN